MEGKAKRGEAGGIYRGEGKGRNIKGRGGTEKENKEPGAASDAN